jgi:hypothetical protein
MSAQDTKKTAAVIIPFYKDTLTAYETIALEQCFKVLSAYSIIAIKPQHLVLPDAVTAYAFADIISFDDTLFKGVEGYNTLMLSPIFYKAFLAYEFMLIHQLDAFVFEDKLSWWCTQGFDYIGAPWLKPGEHPDVIKALTSNIKYYFHTRNDVHKNGEPSKYQYENKVGNGGFSLRRVEKIYNLCVSRESDIKNYLAKGGHHYNEDRYLSVEVNRKHKALNIPGYKIGAKFAIEMAPERAMRLNNDHLPFGCHAWDKQPDFWRPIFKKCGYTI